MAKYTETFDEYVENGGVLPSSSFALIEDFEDLFKERFCALEIGYETEALFALKLDYKARVVMPLYADRIAAVVEQITGVKDNPIKWHYEEREYGETHSENETHSDSTELPFDVAAATPSSKGNMNGEATTNAHTDKINFKEGLSVDERIRLIELLNRKAFSLVEACLEEFKPLFMGIY